MLSRRRCRVILERVFTVCLAMNIQNRTVAGIAIHRDTNNHPVIQTKLKNLHTTPHLSTSRRHSLSRLQQHNKNHKTTIPVSSMGSIINDYVQMMRPVTILQAVGALVVGRLSLLSSPAASSSSIASVTTFLPLLLASASVYLSYGAGMVMNDVVDAGMDAMHDDKNSRPVASGRISQWQGWMFCGLLCTLSVLFANASSPSFLSSSLSMRSLSPLVMWTISNIFVMLGYAMGLQRLLVIKNILCGWLAISPLVGANLLGGTVATRSLYLLAAVGFPLQVAREILKDAEDVDVDRGNKKTFPLAIGVEPSRRLAYALVFGVIAGMVLTPDYWAMFASKVSLYPVSVLMGFSMCVRASQLDLQEGQKLLKKSIYVLLAGMIGSLLLQ
jgi:4-hydroxybenzoate polyprenyltransferase